MYPSPSKYVTKSKDVLQLNSVIIKSGSEIVIYIYKLACLGKLFCLECYRFNNVMIVKNLMIIKIVKIINTLVLVISGL